MEQKHTIAIRMLGYGVALDFLDDYCCMGGTIADKSNEKVLYLCERVFRV